MSTSKSGLFFLTFFFHLTIIAQVSPAISSWIQNTTGAVNPTYTNLTCNVQSVYYSSTFSYVSASGVPGYAIGPWFANPNTPADKNIIAKFTLSPVQNTGTKTATGLGAIGLWTNGVQIYNAKDGQYWNGTGLSNGISTTGFNRNALYWEGASFDNCKGHPGPNSAYHHHVSPVCLYSQNASTVHSPIVGYAMDGFPIYGPYAYTNTNGTGAIKRMQSGYALTTATSRNYLTIAGPPVNTTYPWGCMCEDYVYSAGNGDLDQYNGRTCITPEYPGGTYAYFVTIDASGTPAYPFILGSQYYGTICMGCNSMAQTIPGGVTPYLGTTVPVDIFNFTVKVTNNNSAALLWNVGAETNVAAYEIQRSANATDFSSIATQKALGKSSYQFTDEKLPDGKYYYRIKTRDAGNAFKYSNITSVSINNHTFLIIHNNPAKDILTIQENDALYERKIEITDINGKQILHSVLPVGSTMKSFDIQTLYAGMYVIRISHDGIYRTSKLIVVKD